MRTPLPRPRPLPRATPPPVGTGAPGARTYPVAAGHHERRVVVTVLEAAVRSAADQRAHERQEPAAGRRVQRRAARVHLSVHVGTVLRGGTRGSAAPRAGSGCREGRGQNLERN
jgi:hypothetical protein